MWRLTQRAARRLARSSLTGREVEILTWVGQGKTNWEIAKILQISVRTVQKHLEHIFRKIGVENRTSAAVWVLQPGRSRPL